MAAITPIDRPEPTLGIELQRDMSRLVRMFMARDGLTQGQLGDRIGMDQTTVSARMRGKSRWSVEDITRMAMLFGVHPGEFWTDPKDFTPGISGMPDRPSTSGNRALSTKCLTYPQVSIGVRAAA